MSLPEVNFDCIEFTSGPVCQSQITLAYADGKHSLFWVLVGDFGNRRKENRKCFCPIKLDNTSNCLCVCVCDRHHAARLQPCHSGLPGHSVHLGPDGCWRRPRLHLLQQTGTTHHHHIIILLQFYRQRCIITVAI